MQVSINKLASLTGHDRRTITKILEKLPFSEGEKGAHIYDSVKALALIYGGDSLEAARTRQANSQADLNKVKEEELLKTRIPIEFVDEAWSDVFGSVSAAIKADAAKGKPLTNERMNELFEAFRGGPDKWKH